MNMDAETKRMLTELEGYDLLRKYDVPVPDYRLTHSPDEAVAAAQSMGFPVVMKVVSLDVIHKSDAGGVVAGIDNEIDVRSAFSDINSTVTARVPGARIDGIVVEKQLEKGIELIFGGRTDPTFGKVVTFGIGGTLVELLHDVAIRVLPVTDDELLSLIHEIRGYELIKGYRGDPPRDEAALASVLRSVCRMFEERDDIVEFDINPILLFTKGACAVDARFYQASPVAQGGAAGCDTVGAAGEEKPLPADVFRPKSIAVVGASANPEKVGYALMRNLHDFHGKLYGVNPSVKRILDHDVYDSLSSIPGEVDMVIVAVPAPEVPDIIEEAGRKGARLAVVITAGFREIGGEGVELERRLVESAAKAKVRLIGPNCLGIILPHRKINATFDPASPRPGHLAFISQSGAIITTIVDWSLSKSLGLSEVVSVGNQADLGFADYLRIAEADDDTRTIILYIEQVKDGRAFVKVAQDVAVHKHIIAIKSGSSARGHKAASSHTGSLAGSYEVYRAAFRQAGVIMVDSLKEAFQTGQLLASEDYPAGKRAIVMSNAGGFCVLASDYAEKYGLEMADLPADVLEELNGMLTAEWSHENPMDLVGDAHVDRYAQVFDLMSRREEFWDTAFIVAVPTTTLDPRHLAQEIVRFSRRTAKMVVCCLLGGESMQSGINTVRNEHIPNFDELEEAFRTVSHAASVRSPQPLDGEAHKPQAQAPSEKK
jgi:acetyl coenzyme A synthetase (ADP forming)-like protein